MQQRRVVRTDNTSNLSESFTYDPLNRLLTATVSTNVAPVKALTYNVIGNILSKSDVGSYAYAAPGAASPHAVMGISGSTLSTTFTYDQNGNQTVGLGRNITWTSYNMPASITLGTTTISFQNDTDHQRIMQVAPSGTTIYVNAFGVAAELFGAGTNAARWTDYLGVGNAKVGMRITNIAAQTVSTRYFHTDHLGSVAVITDENGVVVERLSYDAWGKRRFANGADDPTGSITSQSTRGYTGQEELDTVALVHLNGRVYDPFVGRMISADPTVTDPTNPQGWNRYSYVGNDPLAFTDPSGFSWLSSFFHSITNFFAHNPIARAILQIAATVILTVVLAPLAAAGYAALAASLAAAGGSAIATGLSGGNLGQILRASAIAGATAFAFYEVGSLTLGPAHASPAFGSDNFNVTNYAENVAGHALVGCASSVASGGSCQSGALSAAVTAGAGPAINGQSFGVALAENAVLGGVASVAGGGKFENGAITGAFGYMFNACGADPHGCLKLGFAGGVTSGLYSAGIITGGSAGVLTLAGVGVGILDVLIGTASGAISDIIGNAVYNSMKIGPYPDSVIIGDSRGNNIPLAPGETLVGSDDGSYVQVRGPDGQPTGVRGDFGGHSGQADPVAQGPHGHVPGVTQPDGNPHLPVRE